MKVTKGMRIVGINDDKDHCCQCGRTNLKRVVWIEHDDGSVQWYGTSCAARIMYKASTKQNRETVLRVASSVEVRNHSFDQQARAYASNDRKTAARECRVRNKGAQTGGLYLGVLRTFQLEGTGYYCLPDIAEDAAQALLDRGWKEL